MTLITFEAVFTVEPMNPPTPPRQVAARFITGAALLTNCPTAVLSNHYLA